MDGSFIIDMYFDLLQHLIQFKQDLFLFIAAGERHVVKLGSIGIRYAETENQGFMAYKVEMSTDSKTVETKNA